jgi:hypothetical protein
LAEICVGAAADAGAATARSPDVRTVAAARAAATVLNVRVMAAL